jgi:hypothetical protein
MNIRLAILALAVGSLWLHAQPKSQVKPNAAAEQPPNGYLQMRLADASEFKVYYAKDVPAKDPESDVKPKPLDVLKAELKRVEEVLQKNPAALAELRKVPIYVEWDKQKEMSNGRGGNALAVYQGCHQLNFVDPTKNRAVTILSLKSLAKEHQPGRDSGRCVVLHELAHAYHDLVIKGDLKNQIAKTYKTAMEKVRHDPALYVATNQYEYFAELTCCYLQGLDYLPRTREDLRERDPDGYVLMKSVWGDKAGDANVGKTSLRKFDLEATTAGVKPGKALVGDLPPKADWAGHPVVVVHFVADDPVSGLLLKELNDKLYADLKDLGLIVFGAESGKAKPQDVSDMAFFRQITFSIVANADLGLPDEDWWFPHAVVYDRTGKCVFRGHPLDALPSARIEVAEAFLASLEKPVTTKSAQKVVDKLKSSGKLPVVFKEITDQLRAAPAADRGELEELRGKLTERAWKIFKEISDPKQLKPADPIAAHAEAKRLEATYAWTGLSEKAQTLASVLMNKNPIIDKELKARDKLTSIVKNQEMPLRIQDSSFDPHKEAFKVNNKKLLDALTEELRKLRKNYPGTTAADQALRVARRWDVDIEPKK